MQATSFNEQKTMNSAGIYLFGGICKNTQDQNQSAYQIHPYKATKPVPR